MMLFLRLLISFMCLPFLAGVGGSSGLTNVPKVAWVDCLEHPIFCSIQTLQPYVDDKFAAQLSNLLHVYAKKYDMDPLLSVAIAMQESSLQNISAKNTVLLVKEECKEVDVGAPQQCVRYSQIETGYTDVGVFQFHAGTIQAYHMDALRLLDDLAYAVDRHFFLLSIKKKECTSLGADWWTCYHSATPVYRKLYREKVTRFYDRIKQYSRSTK